MTPQSVNKFRAVFVAYILLVPGLAKICAAQPSVPSVIATGSVGGTVELVFGHHVVPVAGAKIELISISHEAVKRQTATDGKGRYTTDLPPGTYKILLGWMGGDDCAEVHRASFRLDAGARLTLDFLVMQCPSSEPVSKWLTAKEPEKHAQSQETNPTNVRPTEQTEHYQEQLIPAEQNRWPEIVVSFGKYDNRGDEIRYFSLHQTLLNPFHIPNPPTPLSLPVTITVDRYTLRASSVILKKKEMVFEARGLVSFSDGTKTTNARSAKLFFLNGKPKMEINR